MLHGVGVAHHPAPENRRGAGQVGHALGDEAAGAGLGGAEGEAPVLQKGEDGALQVLDVGAIDHVPQQRPELRLHRGDEGLGLRLGGSLGGDAQLHLPLFGVGGQGGVGHGVHPLPQHGLHRGLPHAEDLQGPGEDGAVGEGPEVGQGPVGEHGPALPGRAGEHEHVDPLGLEGAAGGGAPVVVEDGAALGEQGLLKVVLRHGPGGVEPPEVVGDAVGGGLVELQGEAEGGGQGLLGEVVAGGPQPAGGDEDVGPPLGDVHGGAEAFGVVPHHGVVVDVDAQGGQALGDHLGVGVGDAAQQQLGADRDKLGSMRHWQRPPIANTDIGGEWRRKCAAQRSISAGRIDFARG